LAGKKRRRREKPDEKRSPAKECRVVKEKADRRKGVP